MSPDQLLEELSDAKSALAEQKSALAAHASTIIELRDLLAEKEALIAQLQHYLFGKKSEKNIAPAPAASPQLDVFGEQSEATAEEIREEVAPPKRERKSAPRRPMPKDLPREEITHDLSPEEKNCACCGREMRRIGEDVTEKLALIPARLFVKKHVRPRYACGACKDAVVQAPLPAMTLPRAAADASLLAYLLLSKYADHLPLCRQERIFTRLGIDLPRRKTCGWLMEIAEQLRPLVELMKRRVRARSSVIGADETPLKMLAPASKKRAAKECYLWVYRGDENAPYTIFDFRESRSREGPRDILGDYSGWLVSDAYSAYSSLLNEPASAWKHAACWAHARRKFVDAARSGDTRAEQAISIIAELYMIECEARELDHGARQKLREEKSLLVLAKLREWMNARLDALPKSPLGKAIGYTLDNWEKLIVYTTDGRLPIDNNATERAIRPVAVGRKNWLFAGSERGGEAAAIFFTLIESARRAGVNLWAYFTGLLERLPAHPINQLEELLPDHWQNARK